MIKKKIAVALGLALPLLGGSLAANAAVYTSTAQNFAGNFVISGFKDADPTNFNISLTGVSGVLDLFVPPSGAITGQRIGFTGIDYIPPTPASPANYDLTSNNTTWKDLGTTTFTSAGLSGSHFVYNFNTGSFTSDGTSVTGGSFSGNATTLNLLLGNLFGALGGTIGTGSLDVTHTLSAGTWNIKVSEAPVGGTGFSGLFKALDSAALGGNNDGIIDGKFLSNGAISIVTADGTPIPGVGPTTPVLPSPPAPGAPTDVFVLDNLPVGAVKDADGKLVGLETPLWIDPIVAVGYTYETSNLNFQSVTAPSLGQVPDTDGYEVWTFDGTKWVLAATIPPGGTYTFPVGGVTKFQIRGINPNIALDPSNPLAFPAGVTFTQAGATSVTMSALTVDTNKVPAPGVLSLLGLGLTALVASRRKLA